MVNRPVLFSQPIVNNQAFPFLCTREGEIESNRISIKSARGQVYFVSIFFFLHLILLKEAKRMSDD